MGAQMQKLLDNREFLRRKAIIDEVAKLGTAATKLVDRAKKLDPPDRLKAPNKTLITALEYRALGLGQLPKAIEAAATSKEARPAAATLADPLQILAASDVIYRTSYKLPAQNAIQADKVKEQQVAESEFFPGTTYDKTSPLGAAKVLASIKQVRPSTTDPSTGGPSTGTHGLSISRVDAVRAGRKTQLTPGTTTQLISSEDITFEVTVENGGDSAESNVDVKFTYTTPDDPNGTPKVETIDEITPGLPNSKVIKFILERKSFYLTDVSTVAIEVTPVPDEKRKDNNKASYPVEFTLQ
jgi:hypothetical protein